MVRAPYPIRKENSEAAEDLQVNPADSTTPDEQPPSARSLTGSTRDAVLYLANRAIDTLAQPAIIRVPWRSSRETTAINPSSVLDSDEDTAVPSTAQEEDPNPVLNEHVEDQVDAEDAAQLDPQDEAGTPAMDTVEPSTITSQPTKRRINPPWRAQSPLRTDKICQIFQMFLNHPALS